MAMYPKSLETFLFFAFVCQGNNGCYQGSVWLDFCSTNFTHIWLWFYQMKICFHLNIEWFFGIFFKINFMKELQFYFVPINKFYFFVFFRLRQMNDFSICCSRKRKIKINGCENSCRLKCGMFLHKNTINHDGLRLYFSNFISVFRHRNKIKKWRKKRERYKEGVG